MIRCYNTLHYRYISLHFKHESVMYVYYVGVTLRIRAFLWDVILELFCDNTTYNILSLRSKRCKFLQLYTLFEVCWHMKKSIKIPRYFKFIITYIMFILGLLPFFLNIALCDCATTILLNAFLRPEWVYLWVRDQYLKLIANISL